MERHDSRLPAGAYVLHAVAFFLGMFLPGAVVIFIPSNPEPALGRAFDLQISAILGLISATSYLVALRYGRRTMMVSRIGGGLASLGMGASTLVLAWLLGRWIPENPLVPVVAIVALPLALGWMTAHVRDFLRTPA